MAVLRAGFGRADITPKVGCTLVGYSPRESTGIHDRLLARALVVEHGDNRWAVVSCEFCFLNINTVAEIRAAIQQRLGIPPSNVMLTTTHTHSGPFDRDADNWERPLAELVGDAVEAAANALVPARLGSAYGFLYGYSINRRFLDRPVDPGLAVVRIDDESGNLLGLLTNFACHAVVLGSDNLQISGDWPGYTCAKLEETLGPGITCLFTQGGAGEINPLVEGVRARLHSGHVVTSIGDISSYYGADGDPERWSIGNRAGGTFEEVAELGEAFTEEVLHILSGMAAQETSMPPWSEQITVPAIADPDEPHASSPSTSRSMDDIENLRAQGFPAEVMVLQLGDALLVGQPGEVFSETAVRLKAQLRILGWRTPMLVSYANGWLSYLPEPEAFDEGGYEVSRALDLGSSRHIQPRIREALLPLFQRRAPAASTTAPP
jgi:neutral ceramidase